MADEELLLSYENEIQIIKFNRPSKLNSITVDVFNSLIEALGEAATRDDVKLTVLTGQGKYFSAGNDFSMPTDSDNVEGSLRVKLGVVSKFIKTLIAHPKPLIAIINGPAIGIAVTMLAHFDIIYAIEGATFHTPFSSLGLCAEGCSSFWFPKLLGKSLASKMLFFNYKMSAKEAKDCGFVGGIYKVEEIPKIITELKEYAKLPLNSLMTTKRLVQSPDFNTLNAVNHSEIDALVERFTSEDFFNALMAFSMRNKGKSKL